jgi:8-amino-7-oxononanoate synthase
VSGFTSALYLGLGHAHAALRPWARLTAGMPAALAPPEGARAVAGALAGLAGLEAAVLGASTLHLFWDLFGQARRRPVRILADASLYPVGRWGIERAAAAGVEVETFPHQDAAALARQLARGDIRRRRPAPLVVTDGLCMDCGRVAPLGRYLRLVEARGGWLVLDDSQALGLLGGGPGPGRPYGRGGGGSPAFLGVASQRLLTVASLAKSFGAPLAMLGGPRAAVHRFARLSETRVYSSPPAVAAVRAAEAALAANRERGDRLRAGLASRVWRFRRRLAAAGIATRGGASPVQDLDVPAGVDAAALHRRLLAAGVAAVLRRGACRPGPLLSFVLRADHEPAEIERAAATVIRLIGERAAERR